MSRQTIVAALLVLFTMLFLFACAKRDARGWWKPSTDGKTYFVLDDGDGAQKGQFCLLDDKVWPYGVGERGEIEPGSHQIGCRSTVAFKVEKGMEYHFDHWAP